MAEVPKLQEQISALRATVLESDNAR